MLTVRMDEIFLNI